MRPILLQLTQPNPRPGYESIWIGAAHVVTMEVVGEHTQIKLSVSLAPDSSRNPPKRREILQVTVMESPEEIEKQLTVKSAGKVWPPEKAFPPEGPKVYGA